MSLCITFEVHQLIIFNSSGMHVLLPCAKATTATPPCHEAFRGRKKIQNLNLNLNLNLKFPKNPWDQKWELWVNTEIQIK